MADGIFDYKIMKEAGYSIATVDSDENAIKEADYVTTRGGGKKSSSRSLYPYFK